MTDRPWKRQFTAWLWKGLAGMPLALRLSEKLGIAFEQLASVISWPLTLGPRFESRLGLTTGMGWPILALAAAVSVQWILLLSQLFCRPCMRTIFDLLSLLELLLSKLQLVFG